MTLNASGQLDIGGTTTGVSINFEADIPESAQTSLGNYSLRTLAGVASGAISFSNFYSKTYTGAGGLWTWGNGGGGRLGYSSVTSRSSPGTVSGAGTTWKQVTGGYFTAGIKTDGTLWTCGYNSSGELGTGDTTNRSSPVTTSGAGTTWKQVSSSGSGAFSAAVKTDGTLWTWGLGNNGVLGYNSASARSSPGTVSGAGTTWKQVACGYYFVAAVKTDGTLWTWGAGDNGQLGTNSTLGRSSPGTVIGSATTWKQVACNATGFSAVKTDGTLWACGYNLNGELGDGTSVGKSSPVQVSGGGTTWRQTAGAYYHTAAVKTNGSLWTWGDGFDGKLGYNSSTSRSSPGTTAGAGTNWKQIYNTSTCFHNVTVKTDGTLWTWGSGGSGVLGNSGTTSRSSPITPAGGITSWKQVGAGSSHSLAIS